MTKKYKDRRKIGKLRSGYYDIDAPKFRYVKDIGAFTRKTNRVARGDILELGEVSKPPSTKRASSLYPWTKPLPGYKRVFVGYGRWRSKGRQTRKKQGVTPTALPFDRPKRKFSKYPSTYGWSADLSRK